MTKISEKKTLKAMFLEEFMNIIIYQFLRTTIPLIILSFIYLPLYFLTNKQLDTIYVLLYLAGVLLVVVVSLLMIRRDGVKEFWKSFIYYGYYYPGKLGEFTKWFIIIISLGIIITAVVMVVQIVFAKIVN